MKKLILFVCAFMLSMCVFANYPIMDGSTHEIAYGFFINWQISWYQQDKIPTMKHFIKPFHCKIWTNYIGDPGYGIKIDIGSGNVRLEGSYANMSNKPMILTKDHPINLYATFGIIEDDYKLPLTALENQRCSPYDSHCRPDKAIIYEECDLI